jgi:hypothetical protein
MVTHPFNPRSLPIVGGQIAKIGQVYDTLASPCDVSTDIWIKAAFHATPYLLLSLTLPECFALELPRGGKRHKRLKRFRFRFSQILQPTLVIRGLPSYARFAWGTLERAGWIILVVDATTDFAVNWTSMAYQWSECDTPSNPWASAGNGFAWWEAGPQKQMLFDSLNGNGSGLFASANGITASPGINCSVAVAGKAIQGPGSKPLAIQWEVRDFGTGEAIMGGRNERDDNGDVGFGDFNRDWPFLAPGRQYRLYLTVQAETSHVQIVQTKMEAFGRETKGLIPAMPDCNPFN